MAAGCFFIFWALYKLKILVSFISRKTAPIFGKLGWRDYFESNLRAAAGTPPERPFGTTLHFFNWDRLRFNPVYLSARPVPLTQEIGTEVVLGPQAKKPLQIKIPIMIAGMSYGSALSCKAKIALAMGATMAGTATNSGNGPFLEEERAAAARYILQFSRGYWAKQPEILKQVDMIEINLGQGAWGPAPVRIKGSKVTARFAKRLGTIPGLDLLIESRLPEVENFEQWKNLIVTLKEITGGVPVACKIGCTHYLEKELELIVDGGVDIIVIDGVEGGTHACPPVLLDDVGLPILPGLCRAVKFLREQGLWGKVSLVAGGGLVTPGDFLKCLALGADAVIIGTIAALVMVHTQGAKVIPWEPPTGLIYYDGKEAGKYNFELGARRLHNYLQSCVLEMKEAARAMGKSSLRELGPADLVALDPLYAKITGVENL